MKEQNTINTLNETTIIQTVKPGQYIRNGFNHLFLIAGITPEFIWLRNQDSRNQVTRLSLRVFAQLYSRKNYTQVHQPDRFLNEWIEAKSVGAQRLMIK